jgi:hypothetical protein
MEDYEKAFIEKAALVFLLLVFATIIGLNAYKYFYLQNAGENQPHQSITGSVKDIKKFNSYSQFRVNDVLFRSEFNSGSCLDIRGELEEARMVKIDYVLVSDWPGTKSNFGCIIKIDYMTPMRKKYVGQASRNN